MELKDFAILCEKFIIALHISLPIVQGEQNFIHTSYLPVKAFYPPPTSPQVMPTEKKIAIIHVLWYVQGLVQVLLPRGS